MISTTLTTVLLIVAVLAVVLAVYLVYGRRAEKTTDRTRIVPGSITKPTKTIGDTAEFDYIVDEKVIGCPRTVPGITRKFTGDTVEFDYIVDKQLYTGTFKKLDNEMIYDQTIMVTIVKQRDTSSPYKVLAINYMMPIVVMGNISEINVEQRTKKEQEVVIKFINPTNEVQTITWELEMLKRMKIPAKIGNTVPIILKCMTNVKDLDSPLLCLPMPFDYRSYS